MQPKNQRDSLDSRALEVENRGSVYRPKNEGRVTISSKEKQTLQKNLKVKRNEVFFSESYESFRKKLGKSFLSLL